RVCRSSVVNTPRRILLRGWYEHARGAAGWGACLERCRRRLAGKGRAGESEHERDEERETARTGARVASHGQTACAWPLRGKRERPGARSCPLFVACLKTEGTGEPYAASR